MPTSLLQYEMLPTTWFYISALMIIATFFKFNRFLSIRNLDLVGLIFLTPGLLWIARGDIYTGYFSILTIGFLLFLRLWLDLFLVRRPLLEPNLASSGLIFACVMLIGFLVPNLLINRGERVETSRTVRLEQILTTQHVAALEQGGPPFGRDIPGYRPFYQLTEKLNQLFLPSLAVQQEILDHRTPGTESNGPSESEEALSQHLSHEDRAILEQHRQYGVQQYGMEPSGPFRTVSLSRKFGDQGVESDASTSAAAPPSGGEASPETSGSKSTGTVRLGDDPRANVESLNLLIAQEEQERIRHQRASPLFDEVVLILCMVLAQFGIVFGMITIGHCHFGNFKTGVAAAMLYLLLPYVNQMTGRLDHFIPGMLLVLAVTIYRRPIFSGFFLGLAASLVFYPFFLLPLWIGFYWKRGAHRFVIGVFSAVMTMVLLLLFSPTDLGSYPQQLASVFGWHSMALTNPVGVWEYAPTYYRIPIIALYLTICVGLMLWPPQKNLATLISCSAMLMLGVGFWQGYCGGLYMGWYLPLLVLTLFRPNLEDRVASSTVIEV